MNKRVTTALLLLSLALAIAACAAEPGEVVLEDEAAAAPKLKWHPGHYVLLDGVLRPNNISSLKSAHFTHIDEICNLPEWKGVEVFLSWAAFEGATPGDYTAGLALVKSYLDKLAPCRKRLILSVMHVHFGGFGSDWSIFFPRYLIDGAAYGISEFNLNGYGLQARIWQAATMDRVIAMNAAIGAAFDAHPYFEMIVPDETSVNLSLGTDGYTAAALIAQIKRSYTQARAAFPRSQVRLAANYVAGGDAAMIDLIAHCRPLRCIVGGPDVLPAESIQANRIFSGTTGGHDYRGELPFIAEVQSPELGGKEGTYTPPQLYNHINTGTSTIRPVRAEYWIWFRNTWSGGSAQRWSTAIRPFVETTLDGAVHHTTCPTAFTSGCDPS